jgi:hypothetical protein
MYSRVSFHPFHPAQRQFGRSAAKFSGWTSDIVNDELFGMYRAIFRLSNAQEGFSNAGKSRGGGQQNVFL